MHELEIILYRELNKIHTCKNEELPLKFDFSKNKIGMYFLLNDIGDYEYKYIAPFEIHFYSLEKNKIENMKLVQKVDEYLNKKLAENVRFTRKNPYLLNPKDTDGKTHYILNYYANMYKRR